MHKNGNKTTYEVELEDGDNERTIIFDESGKRLKEWRDV